MSAIRRLGVIADHGSLAAYRDFVISGQDTCAKSLAACAADPDVSPCHVAALAQDLVDWRIDLAWVDGELSGTGLADVPTLDPLAALQGGDLFLAINERRRA